MPTTWSKLAQRRVQHVAHAELGPAARPAAARAPGPTNVADRSIATTSAPRRRAASTASAPVPQPASSMRRPCRSSGSQPSSVARMRSRPARTVARMPLTGASEVRRDHASDGRAVEIRLQLAAAGEVGGGAHQS